MRDAHGRVGRVDALAAVARGVVDVDAQVLGVDVDLDLVWQHRQDLDAGEGGLPALLRVRGRDAHQPVHASFGAEHAVGVLAVDGEGRPVDADDLARGAVVDVDFPAAAVAVAQVHAEQHLAPVLGLEAALAGGHGDDGVAVVEVVGEPAGELELRELAFQLCRRGGGLVAQVVVARLFRELERRRGVVELLAGVVDGGDVGLRRCELRHHLAGGVCVVPQRRVAALILEALDVQTALIDVEIPLHLGETCAQSVERFVSDVCHAPVPSGSCRGSS